MSKHRMTGWEILAYNEGKLHAYETVEEEYKHDFNGESRYAGKIKHMRKMVKITKDALQEAPNA